MCPRAVAGAADVSLVRLGARLPGGFAALAAHDRLCNMSTPIDNAKYVSIETFRKDGTGVKTPM